MRSFSIHYLLHNLRRVRLYHHCQTYSLLYSIRPGRPIHTKFSCPITQESDSLVQLVLGSSKQLTKGGIKILSYSVPTSSMSYMYYPRHLCTPMQPVLQYNLLTVSCAEARKCIWAVPAICPCKVHAKVHTLPAACSKWIRSSCGIRARNSVDSGCVVHKRIRAR